MAVDWFLCVDQPERDHLQNRHGCVVLGTDAVATIQLSDVLGAQTIGTSTSREKLDRLSEIGADYTIQESDPETIAEAVTNIGEPDATINHRGGAYTRIGLRDLRRGGCMDVCGRTASVTSEIDIPDLYLGA